MRLELKVLRKRKSYDFKADKKKPDDFSNNWKNNSLDDFILLVDGKETFKCKCQSVANYCFGAMATAGNLKHGASLKEGKFNIECFVPPRLFHGEIHAIVNSTTMNGLWINNKAMQITADGFQNGRWLIHDRYSFKLNKDTNYAWSAGCLILSSADLEKFNEQLKRLGVNAGDKISGRLFEIE